MFKLKNVVKEYTSKSGKVVALNNINLTLQDTGFVFLLGKSGCGKSTFLNVLSGLDKVTSGDIEVNGENLKDFSPKALDDYRNRSVGFVFQEYNLIEEYSVYENVAISLSLRRENNIDEKVSEALTLVGLAGYEKRKISELSGGQKQRIAIARAIVANVEVLFADEPTGNLDSVSSKEIFEILQKLSKKILVFTVTHDAENAKQYGDRIITMSDGLIVSDEIINEIPEANVVYNKNKQVNKRGINLLSLTKLSFINIWKKKWRLLVTTVLFFFTLTMFGIAISAFRYDEVNTMLAACYENNLDEFKFQKNETELNKKSFSQSELKKLQEQFPNHKFDFLYDIQYMRGLDIEGLSIYGYSDSPIAVINNDIVKRYGYELSYGKLPTKAGEICLSKYMVREILENKLIKGVTDYDTLCKTNIKIKIYPDISFKVVGVLDTKIDDLYKSLDMAQHIQEASFTEEVEGSYTAAIMVSEGFLKDCYLSDDYSCNSTYQYYTYNSGLTQNKQSLQKPIYSEGYAKLATEQNGIFGEILYKRGKSSLAENEVIVPYKVISEMAKLTLSKNQVSNNEILNLMNSTNLTLRNVQVEYDGNSNFKYFNIVGFYTNNNREEIIVSNDFLTNTKQAHGVTHIITKLSGKRATDYDLAEYLFVGAGSEEMRVNGMVWKEIWNSTIASSYNKDLGLYGTIAAGIFSILMMANFIVTSINNNKKQIGILRALGMRTIGVLYIFMLEALLVGLLSFALSVASLYIAVAITGFYKGYAVTIQQLFITPVEILSMFGLSIAICVFASIIPILKKARVQPINLIKDLN